MAVEFVVEDGTGLDDATSYLAIADADQHHENRGNDAWLATDTKQKQIALNRAAEYLDLRFLWRGLQTNPETDDALGQALQFPRTGILVGPENVELTEDEVPVLIEKAAAELALISLTVDLLPNDLGIQGTAQVLSESEKAGDLSVSRRFAELKRVPAFRAVLALIQPLRAPAELLRA